MAKWYTLAVSVLADDDADAANALDLITNTLGDSVWEPAMGDDIIVEGKDDIFTTRREESNRIESNANLIRYGFTRID